MNDEIKNADNHLPDGEADAALNGELNHLRDMFQQEWNKTMAETEEAAAAAEEAAADASDGAPAIQELDYAGESEEEQEEETQSQTDGGTPAPEKKKKKEKKRSRVPLVILIIVLVLILIPLLAYFVLSVTTPTFGSFLSAYSSAMTAQDEQAKLTAYQDALTYCEDGTVLGKMKQSILEKIVVLTNETSGYTAAAAYMKTNMTEDMIAKPVSAEFRDFVKIGDSVREIADKAFDATEAAFQKAGSAAALDIDALHADLGTPDMIKTEVAQAVTALAQAMEKEKNASSEEDWQEAITGYLTGAQAISNLGGNNLYILEKVAVKLYNNGYLFETKTLIDNYFDEEALAAPKTEEFKAMQAEIDAFGDVDADIFAIAEELYKNGTTADADIKKAIPGTLKDSQKTVLAAAAKAVIDGLTAEAEKNLTKAQKDFGNALNTMNALEMDASPLAKKLVLIYVATGDTQSANKLREEQITDEVLAASDDAFKAQIADLDLLYAAQNAANEVFGSFYQNYYYSGAALDKAEIGAALDALNDAEDANKYTAPFAAYYKYLAEAFTDENADAMADSLKTFAAGVGDYPALYGASLGEVYKMQENFTQMEAMADQLLAIDISDDFANSAKSLVLRIDGKVEEALAAAEKGIELSGKKQSCAAEALICNILLKNYEKAAEYAFELYDANLTVNNCEYILILNALYDGDDSAVKEQLSSYKSKIDEIFTNYSVTVSEKTQGIIDGAVSPEDVFLGGKYYLF